MSETLSRDPKLFTHDLGVLTRRITALIASSGLKGAERKEYLELKKSYFAYAEYAIQNTSGDVQKAYIDQRIEILTAVASFEAKRLKWVRRQGVHVAEWFRSMPPALQYLLMGGAMTAVLGFSVALRSMAVGVPAAIIMVASAFGAGFYVRGKLNKWAGQGAENSIIRWIVNAREVEAAEQELQTALAEYSEKDRHTGVKRIARAMAKKRSALFGQKLTIMAVGSLFGIGAGRGALLAADAGLFDIATSAQAATLHEVDGTTREIPTTGDSWACYNRIAAHGGWFVVKNSEGTYNLYFYDKANNIVRFATGGVENLNEITENPIIELSRTEVNTLNVVDRQTVLSPMKSWTERTLTENLRAFTGYGAMSEAEMREAGLYTLTPVSNSLGSNPNYWGDVQNKIWELGDRFMRSGRTLIPITVHSWIDWTFNTLFVAGKPGGMSDQDIFSLYRIIVDRIETGVDLEGNTVMDIREDSDFGDSRPSIYGREDVSMANKPAWYRAWVQGHEVGHAVQGLLKIDTVLADLPVAEREEILREMHDLFEYLKEMKAEGARSGFEGWSEDKLQLFFVNASATDKEIFADLFSKMLTHPDVVRGQAPHFYALVQGLVNGHPTLRQAVGIV